MNGPGSLPSIAERLLDLATAEGATQAEALVLGEDSALTRFANSGIHQNVAHADVTLNLRVVIGRRIGVARSNRLDPDSLAALARDAAAIARVQPEREDFVSLPSGGTVSGPRGGHSAATTGSSPESRADSVAAVICQADAAGVQAFGSCSVSTERLVVANTLGIRADQATTSAQLIVVCTGPGGESGYAEAVAVDVDAIDPVAIGREAATRAHAARSPRTIEPGEYPVVLDAYAVVDLVDQLGYLGFTGLAVEEGRSFFEPGKRIGSDLVTIVDDGSDPAGTPSAFDYEGVPKRPVTLVERGVCREVVYDSQTAARAKRESTGHGLPAPNPWGPMPLNPIMSAGTATRDELIGGVARGLLVTRFHYTNAVQPKLAIVTGMTRDGTFLIEDGEVVGPVRNLRYTQSYLDALAGVEAVGAERRLLRGFLGSVLVPAVRIGAFDFTGATEH